MSSSQSDPLQSFYRRTVAHALPRAEDSSACPALLCVDLQGLDASREQGIFEDVAPGDQRFYFDSLEDTVVPNVQRLQWAFRRSGHEIIHARIQSLTRDGRDRGVTHKRLGILAVPGSREARFLPQVAPRFDEIVVNKTSSGVFESTRLDYVLNNIGVDSLVIVGVYTNECVSTAARVASDLGFLVTVVEDACTAVTPELHAHAIETLNHRYARVVSTDQAIEEILDRPSGQGPDTPAPSAREPAAPSSRNPTMRSELETSQGRASRRVVLLGGHALADTDGDLTMGQQFAHAERALEQLVPLFENGDELVISHGNGPQVGHMLARVEAALGEAYALPLEVCVAESEGELGYVLQQSLHNTLRRHGLDRPVASLVTQTIVSATDPAFEQPSKPIGPAWSDERAEALRERGYALKRDPDGGLRRVVPSPQPIEIVETDVVQELLRTGVIALAAGGGGVPVIEGDDGQLEGIDGVVDKDLAGALLASAIGADEIIILTSVPCVYRHYGTDQQEPIRRLTPREIEHLAEQGHFGSGTMAPKVEAARRFALRGGSTVICSIDTLADALAGRAGTHVVPEDEA